MRKLPLEGIRILDLCVVWAGPFGAMQLADLGAEVIRVEAMQYTFVNQRGVPYPSRAPQSIAAIGHYYPDYEFGERPWNRFAVANYYGRNKLGMTVDLSRAEGVEVFKRLVKMSDGVVENQAARNMEAFGLDYDVLSQLNPGLIMVRFPGFGTSGPYKHRLGYGFTMDAITAHTSLRRYPDLPPDETTTVYHGDACAGAAMAGAFIQALLYRARTGKGQLIDMSQCENVIHTFAPAYMDFFMNGRVQEPMGNRDSSMVQGCYPCDGEDKWCVISIAGDEQWEALCDIMGRPDLAGDPRFVDVLSRRKNQDELDGYVIEWTLFQDQYEVMRKLQAAGIAAGPVIENPDVHRDPHVQAREHMVAVEHADCGIHRHTGPLYKLSETPCRMGAAPLLGQHNMYIYRELLGYSDDEIERLVKENHIGDRFLPEAR